MTPARFQTIEEIFLAALDQEPDQIGAFLDKTCGGDEVLRRKVEALLASRQRVGSFIETSAVGIATRIIGNGQADLLVGQTFGHYKISSLIGTGGMGEVYLATDVKAGRKAALKFLPERFTGEAERLKRFEQEARAVVGLNHPNVVTVYEIGEENSIHYIASELIEGETLRDRLTRGSLQLSEALDVAIQVASALTAAHRAGIVHRDIKPENIMLRPDGYVKVLDFGIAKLAEQELPTTMPRDEALLLVETNLGSILGTVRYMSPEQARGAQIDKTTDIWSLGVVLYEMTTGHAPFTGDTPKEVMSSILEKEPAPLTRYIAHAPAELQQIISKTLRKDRAQRYHSAHGLLEALKDLRRKLEFESFVKSGFFEEVKRRKVYRVALAYIIAAGGIIQLASAVFPAWELPNWALRLVVVLLLIGFPLALILGWVFDITSHGIRVTPGTHRRLNAIVLVAAGVIISTAVGFLLLPRVSAHKIDKSIAVLPFDYFGADKDNAYLADGVQDDILTDLAKVADLKVISRRSVAQYRGSTTDVREIGKALQVAYVLEGTVRKVGDKIRVSAQLIDTRTEGEKWAEKYDRDFADIFAIQNEISETIADQLKAVLTPEEKATIETAPTRDMEAYDLYLRARSLVNAFGLINRVRHENLLKAEPLLQAAIARDPKFVLAYCLLAEVQWNDPWQEPTPERIAQARANLETALKIAPESAEVHLQLGSFYYNVANGQLVGKGQLPWSDDMKRAKEEFRIAARKLPNSVVVLGALADFEQNRGQWKEALQHSRRAAELDPRDPDAALELAEVYGALRRYPEADKVLDNMIAILPHESTAFLWTAKGKQAAARGDIKAAMAAFDAHPFRNKGVGGVNFDVARIMVLERRYDEATALLSSLEETARTHNTFASQDRSYQRGEWEIELGTISRARGQKEQARAAFEAAKKDFTDWLALKSEEPKALGYVAICDAGLGNKEEALRQGRKALELWPKSRDYHSALQVRKQMALVYAWTADHNAALTQLQELAPLPDILTFGELKLHPQWDDLRHEPLFDKVLAVVAKPADVD